MIDLLFRLARVKEARTTRGLHPISAFLWQLLCRAPGRTLAPTPGALPRTGVRASSQYWATRCSGATNSLPACNFGGGGTTFAILNPRLPKSLGGSPTNLETTMIKLFFGFLAASLTLGVGSGRADDKLPANDKEFVIK